MSIEKSVIMAFPETGFITKVPVSIPYTTFTSNVVESSPSVFVTLILNLYILPDFNYFTPILSSAYPVVSTSSWNRTEELATKFNLSTTFNRFCYEPLIDNNSHVTVEVFNLDISTPRYSGYWTL